MRFSQYQQCPPSDPVRERGRRRAKFAGSIKAEIKEAANAKGLSLTGLAEAVGCDKSVVSRALNSDSNIEIFTMFDFAEALGKEWSCTLRDRHLDLGDVFAPVAKDHFRTSWTPVRAKAKAGNAHREGTIRVINHPVKVYQETQQVSGETEPA